MALPLDYLDRLDRLLVGQGEDRMLLTQIDDFLTGIIMSSEPIWPNQ